MSKEKKTPIKYTSREFDSIKNDLVEHAKRLYPEQWKDFSKGTINSFFVDTVAYIGDVLSYYVDYQANESFMETAVEYGNIRKHARSLGYKYAGTPSSYGFISLYVLVPSTVDGTAPDFNYLPSITKGSSFSTTAGAVFTLTEDVSFADSNNEIVAARFDDNTGATTHFAVKTVGQVSSGVYTKIDVELSSTFKKFRKIRIGDPIYSEIISVIDSDGNSYYEVENLAQEVIFKEVVNREAIDNGARSILKPFIANRRFVLEQDDSGTYLQFGFGSELSEAEEIADPSKVLLEMHGKNYIYSESFDPSRLIGSTKLGVAPSGTKLTIIAKSNTTDNSNAEANSLTRIQGARFKFRNEITLDQTKKNNIIKSLEVTNEEPIIGLTQTMTNEELKNRAKSYYASQSRAVTKQDYESMIYNMPAKFGKIKRVSIINDPSASNRRMAIYIVGEGVDGKLVTVNDRIKMNIKHWISQYKSLNDVVDIFDAKIVNFSIDFKVVADPRFSNEDIIARCNNELKKHFSNQLYIGEGVLITRIYSILSKVQGVSDVKKVTIAQKRGENYSPVILNFKEALSKDGSYLNTPKNVIMELKYPEKDIKGVLIK